MCSTVLYTARTADVQGSYIRETGSFFWLSNTTRRAVNWDETADETLLLTFSHSLRFSFPSQYLYTYTVYIYNVYILVTLKIAIREEISLVDDERPRDSTYWIICIYMSVVNASRRHSPEFL